MKKFFAYYFIATLCCISFNLHSAASNKSLSASPTGTGWTEYLSEMMRAGYGWVEKRTGTKPIDYCIDKNAQQLLKNAEQTLELALADNRVENRTKTYSQLMANPAFQQLMKQLGDRAYFDWEHIRAAIAEDRFSDVAKIWKINRVNLSPCLRTAIETYLEQNREKQKAADNPKKNVIRFDLSRMNSKPGYVEASTPEVPQQNTSLPDLTKTIRDHASSLTITSPLQNMERRTRKTFDSSFSLTYLTSKQEVEKAQRIYAVFFSYLFRAQALQDSISELFKREDFLSVYNQVWDRDMQLRYVIDEQLKRGSLDACTIYANHKQNISPLFAALVCDMILSHQQQENTQHVSETFRNIFFIEKKPYEKYVFMFLNSLTKQQKINLFNIRDQIGRCIPQQQSATIHQAVRADDAQLELLAEIQRGNHIPRLLEAIRQACIDITPVGESIEINTSGQQYYSTQSPQELILAIDIPSPSRADMIDRPSRGNTDEDEADYDPSDID